MTDFRIKSGDNLGTPNNDIFRTLDPIKEAFKIDGGDGLDKWIADLALIENVAFSLKSIEEITLTGTNGAEFILASDAQKIDASSTDNWLSLIPLASDMTIIGGKKTYIRVDQDIPAASKLSLDIATGAASGFVTAQQQDSSLKGTYTNITGVISLGTDDTVFGADGYQFVQLGGGTNYFDGRGGIDRAIYDGAIKHFSTTLNKSGVVTIHDRRLSSENIDTLVNVEEVYFDGDDRPLRDISILASVVNVEAADLTSFIEMYIAYFNRAPDAEGLFYWGTRLSQGMSKEKIAESFYVQPETQALYTNPEDTKGFVTNVYQNFLGRAPDTDGFNYWVKQLDDGIISKPSFLLAIINGAKASTGNPDDVAYFTDKAKLGIYFSVTKGMSNVDSAKAAMALYTGSAESLTAAKNAIDGYYNAALDAQNGEAIVQLIGVLDDPFAVI